MHLKNLHQLKNIFIDIQLASGVPKKNSKRKTDPKKVLNKFSYLEKKISQMSGTEFMILDQDNHLSLEEWEALKQLGVLRFS